MKVNGYRQLSGYQNLFLGELSRKLIFLKMYTEICKSKQCQSDKTEK